MNFLKKKKKKTFEDQAPLYKSSFAFLRLYNNNTSKEDDDVLKIFTERWPTLFHS